MNYLQFRTKLVRRVRRTDFTATCDDIHSVVNEARRDVQTRYNFAGMEASGKFTNALVTNDYRFALPDSFKEIIDLRVLDPSNNIKLVLAKEADRSKFNRMVVLDTLSWVLEEYKDSIILMDLSGLEGAPLIYNIWGEALELFPKVGATFAGNYLWMSFFRYLDIDLSTLSPGPGENQMDRYSDFLFREQENLTFYASMMHSGLHFKDEGMVSRWETLLERDVSRLYINEVAKRESGRAGGCFGD